MVLTFLYVPYKLNLCERKLIGTISIIKFAIKLLGVVFSKNCVNWNIFMLTVFAFVGERWRVSVKTNAIEKYYLSVVIVKIIRKR